MPPRQLHFSFVFALLVAVFSSASAQTLTPSEILAFRAQLVNAQRYDAALGPKEQCYGDHEVRLQAQSAQLQEAAGDLHRQEQSLSAEVERAGAEANAFSDEAKKAEGERSAMEMQIRQIDSKIRAVHLALAECRHRLGFLGFFCDVASEISGLNTDLHNLIAAHQATSTRIAGAENRMQAAIAQRDQAEERLKAAQTSSNRNSAELASVESKITAIKASLAEIRALRQDSAVLRDQFGSLLSEFEGLDPASDRMSVTRRLRRQAEELNALQVRVMAMIGAQGLQLPGGERICAN